MRHYDFFCDASIDLKGNIACAGCFVVDRSTGKAVPYYKIQVNATNNSAEILAIYMGIQKAVEIARSSTEDIYFRLFSDSKISLYGVRMWMSTWVRTQSKDGVFMNSSGDPVANQEYFIAIYNMIVDNNLHIEFFHQRGHISGTAASLDRARWDFKKANKCFPEYFGLNMADLCYWNNMVDNGSRAVLKDYIVGRYFERIECDVVGDFPIDYKANGINLAKYSKCISTGFNEIELCPTRRYNQEVINYV